MSGNSRARVIDFTAQHNQQKQEKGPFSDVPLELAPALRDMMSYGRTCFGRGSIKMIDHEAHLIQQISRNINDPSKIREIIEQASADLRRMRNESKALMYQFEDD